jgi:hypothetical protein
MKDMLNEENIEYYERDIDVHKKEYDDFVKLTENDYLPSFSIITIDENNEVNNFEYLVPDESFNSLDEAVEKIKEKVIKG